jgi:hypothetical protein
VAECKALEGMRPYLFQDHRWNLFMELTERVKESHNNNNNPPDRISGAQNESADYLPPQQ